MSIQDIHGNYAVRLFDSTQSSEVVLDGVSNQAVNINTMVGGDGSSGALHPRFLPITGQTFSCPITTMRLKDVLDNIGVEAFFFVDDTGKPGLEIIWQKYAESAGGRASGSSHIKHTISEGVIIPRSLTVSHQGDASLSYEVIPKYDGTNDPVIYSGSQSIPSLVGDDERFTLGPITIGGQSFSGNFDVTINFGVQERLESSDSDIWPTRVSQVSASPSITISGSDIAIMASKLPITGRLATHANTSIFLRKRSESAGGYVADGTAEHIKITAAGLATLESVSAGQGSRAATAIRLATKNDGTNSPLILDTASVIA